MGDEGPRDDRVLMDALFSAEGRNDPQTTAAAHPTLGCRYAVVNTVLRDRATREPAIVTGDVPMLDLLTRFMARLGGDRHHAVRAPFARVFTPRRSARYASIVRARADVLLSGLEHERSFDLVATYARPLPFGVIADVIGIERSDQPWVEAMMDRLMAGFAGQRDSALAESGNDATGQLLGFFDRLLDARASVPADDLASLLAADDLATSARDDLLANCVFFILAGHATSTALITAGAAILADRPQLLERLRAAPREWDGVVEELLRYVSPITITGVGLDHDVTVGDESFRAGDNRLLCFAAANRDPAVFAEPDHFDPLRDPNPHLAFSVGAHHCLGAPLARLHGTVGLQALFERFPQLRFTEGLQWRSGAPVRQVAAATVIV